MESRSGLKVSFDFDGTLDRKDVQEYSICTFFNRIQIYYNNKW